MEETMGVHQVALTKVAARGRITLPAAVRQAANIEEGDFIEIRVEGDSLILTPKKLIDKSQAYFWTAEWQAAEQEANADIAAGRVQEFDNVEDLIASLESSVE